MDNQMTWLHARAHLTDAQFAAGECLRRDFEKAQIAARERFEGAVKAAGAGLSDILWRVVCAGESLPTAERALAWPVGSGKLVLRTALDRVAGFYGAKEQQP